ncbi:Protein SABRE [Coniosporium tulheliwenetii]|uniref:Protein SABRE n=1 Tax=Coniosporium tulheliwenetii TaxID=3383036 RepID=A0ACC2YUF4_9PEZI|nr:Protein SABRE [Cladosporium sp. JES 115]
MALPSLSFIAGVAVLLYLSTFVLFALLRIVTGISIQRIGWSGLRRIYFSPREGLRVDIRGLGFTLHRPTFAQPTWISIELTQLELSVDLKLLDRKSRKRKAWVHWPNGHGPDDLDSGVDSETPSPSAKSPLEAVQRELQRSRTWERLTLAKEKIKRLHRKINWIRVVDLVAKNSSITVIDVGTIQVASLSVAVDVRRKTVDRTRLFLHRRASSQNQRPAEWIFTARSILFVPEGKDSTEILDHCTLNVHGLLYRDLEGLRDASIALKLGRLSVPYDDLETSLRRIKNCRRAYSKRDPEKRDVEISLADVMEELDRPGSREESIIQTVSDSKEFISSILRGIQEIQFAVGFFGLSKRVCLAQPTVNPIYLNMSMKEVGLDLLRLDPKARPI